MQLLKLACIKVSEIHTYRLYQSWLILLLSSYTTKSSLFSSCRTFWLFLVQNMIKNAIKIHRWNFGWTEIFSSFRHLLRNEIMDHTLNINCIRNYQTAFEDDWTILYPDYLCMRILLTFNLVSTWYCILF